MAKGKQKKLKRPRMSEFVPLTRDMTFDSVSHLARFIRVPYQTVYSFCVTNPTAFRISTPAREGSRRCQISFYQAARIRLSELSTLADSGLSPSSPATTAPITVGCPTQSVKTPVESTSA